MAFSFECVHQGSGKTLAPIPYLTLVSPWASASTSVYKMNENHEAHPSFYKQIQAQHSLPFRFSRH